jgi:heme oxygenase
MNFTTAGDARKALRFATHDVHVKLEESHFSRKIFDENLTALELANILARMISVYRPLELQLLNQNYIPRLPLLLQGLDILKVQESLPDIKVPKLMTQSARLGALYVLEGSTMGGQRIFNKLVDKFPANALEFFIPNGKNPLEKLGPFFNELEIHLANPEKLLEAQNSAISVFELFKAALT